MQNMECLNNIIGVTGNLCDCLKGNVTDDQLQQMGKSNSGLFLDTLPGGIDLGALNNIDTCKSMAIMALSAIDSAIKTVAADLVVALNANYTKAINTFTGLIGQLSYTGTLSVQKRYQAFLLRARDGADAVIQINRIGLIVNAAQAGLTVSIYSAPRGAAMGTKVIDLEIDTLLNNYVYMIPPGGNLILPLAVRGQPMDYYIVYDSTFGVGFSPKDNKINCNCSMSKAPVINQYIQPLGVQLDNLDDFSAGVTDPLYTRGLLIDCQLRCNNEQLICGQYDKTEAISLVLAYATQFKAGELIIENVMQTREINRYTMQNKEYLWGKRNHFISEYQSRITYLADAVDVNSSTCFVCRGNQIYMSTPIITDGGQQNVYDTDIAISEADYIGFNPTLNQQQIPGVIDMSGQNLPQN